MKERALVDLGGVLGTGRELDIRQTLALPAFGSFAFPEPVDAKLVVRRSGGGVAIEGTLAGTALGECGRCLEPASHPFTLDVDERVELGETADPLAENNVLVDGRLDVLDLARQLIDSALPMLLVCDDACAGLCPVCGARVVTSAPCHPQVGDHG